MVELNDLLYWGSIAISLDKEDNLVGSALVELDKGYIPISLSSDDLSVIELQEGVMAKLREGNVLYMIGRNIYLGKPQTRGAYGDEKIFVSEVDVESLTFLGMLQNLEYRIGRNLGKKKTLIKIGEFYRPNI